MRAPLWSEAEIVLSAADTPPDAYALDVEASFRHDDGAELVRPAFWDGGSTWRVRFASPRASGTWRWRARSSSPLRGVDGATGALTACAADDAWRGRGLLRMAPGGLAVERADGSPWILAADTPWALPWRATRAQVEEYAAVRAGQGFTAALLMSVMPDLRRSPRRARGERECWDEGFDDLPDARLRRLRPEYFRDVDALIDVLLAHRLVPVWSPLFHGFGWRGGPMSGRDVAPDECARYCRYLVARYGARPALWLAGADGQGTEPTIAAAGAAIEAADCYRQPTGIHYAPHASNAEHQDAPWLDFQWCQTGHLGEHKPERVAEMRSHRPAKAIACGEPTYERMRLPERAADAWQADEAWRDLCAGALMGVVYGAGSLWQWRQARDEPDQPWAHAIGCDWRHALGFPGARWVGALARALDGVSLAGCAPDWRCTFGRPALLAPDRLFVAYLEDGGDLAVLDPRVPARWRVLDARDASVLGTGTLDARRPAVIPTPEGMRTVVICET